MKHKYESPELDILWFQGEPILTASIYIDDLPGDGVVDDDDEDW